METLELRNFLNHRNTLVELNSVNLFFGPNGAGKSALVSAMEWVMTGTCRDLDARGTRNEALRTVNVEAPMFVRLHGPDGPYAHRLWEHGGSELSVAGATGRMGELEAALWRMVGIERVNPAKGREILKLFLRAGDLSSWSEKSWHDVLGMLSAGGVRDVLDDLARCLSATTGAMTLRPEITAFVTAAKDATWSSVGSMESRPHVVAALERWFSQERTRVRKELATARARAIPNPEDPVVGAMTDPQLGDETRSAEELVRIANTEIQTNRAHIAVADDARVRIAREAEARERIGTRRNSLREYVNARPTVEVLREAEKANERALTTLRKLEKKASTISATPEDVTRAAVVVLEQYGKELSQKSVKLLSQLTAGVVAMGSGVDDLPAELDAARAAVATTSERMHQIQNATTMAIEAEKELEELNGLGTASEPPASVEHYDMHVQACESWQKRKDAAELRLQVLQRENQRRHIMRTVMEHDTKSIERRSQALDHLVDAMRSPTVKSGGGGELFAQIAETMAAGVGALFGENVKLEIPDSGHFLLGGCSWDVLSASEKMRFGCALAAGLARMFKFPWLVIDGAELIVGAENRRRFFSWLGVQQNHFKKIVVLAAADARPAVPLRDGWSVYWVENGAVQP